MGEAKRKRAALSKVEQAALDISHKLANDGKIIEGGFAAYITVHKIPLGHPELARYRDLYFAGAEHFFTTILATLDEGLEPTAKDMERMDKAHAELSKWREMKQAALAMTMPTKGSA